MRVSNWNPQAYDGEFINASMERLRAAAEVITSKARGQIITAGMGEVVDINILAVRKFMDLYNIKNQVEILRRVRSLFHHFLSEDKRKHESDH